MADSSQGDQGSQVAQQQGQAQGPEQQQGPADQPPILQGQPSADADGTLDASLEDTLNRLQNEKRAEAEKPRDDERQETRKPPQPKASVFASLHRREQQVAARTQEIAKREAEIAQREAVFSRGKHTPFEALKLLGYENPQEFLQKIADTGGEWSPEQQKIYELEQRLAQREETEKQTQQRLQEEQQAREYQTHVDNWHKEIASFAKQSPQWRESLAAIPGSEARAFQEIQEHYRATGEQMDFDEALSKVSETMEREFTSALQEIVTNPRGRAILQEYAAKLVPQGKRAKVATAQKQGLNSAVRNPTQATPGDDVDLDTAVEQNARWLSEVMRRGA